MKPNKAKAKTVKPLIIAEKKAVESVEPVNSKAIIELKEESLKWILAITGALLVYLGVAMVILHVYHPEVQSLIDLGNKLCFSGDSRPEPMEALLFRVGILTITAFIFIFYALLSRIKAIQKLAQSPFFYTYSALCIVLSIVLIYLDFKAANPFAAGGTEQPQNARDLVGKSNFDFYFDGLFIGDHLLAYIFVLVPLVSAIFFLGIKKYKWEAKDLYNKIVTYTTYIVLGICVFEIVLINTCEIPVTFENKYDFNAVYYSMTQVFSGTPMLVDGFSNTYGLYPEFLNPLFQVIGLSVFKFSLVMSLLVACMFLFNFYFLRKFVANKIIWFLGCCSILFFPYLASKIVIAFDSVFAFNPIRNIVPSTLVLLVALYLHKRSSIIYWVTSVIMGFFILWNPEIGMVSFISWIVFNIYNDFFTAEGKVNIRKIGFHIAANIAVIIAVIYSFKGVFYLIYGVAPDLGLLFGFITVFGKLGLGLLPMMPVHPWNISALLIIAGVTYSIVKWYKKEITPKASVIFLTSVISVGFLVYYQGRSHNWSFSASTTFVFLLLALLGDELWTTIKDKDTSIWPLQAVFVLVIFLISFSFFELLYNYKAINDLVSQDDAKEKQLNDQNRIASNTEFILKNSREKEKIYVFTTRPYEGLYYDGNKRRAAFNPGYQDMFLNTDLLKLTNRIIDSSFDVFIEPALAVYPFMVRPFAAVAATYQLKAVNQAMYLLDKRKMKLPTQTFFTQGDDIVVHEKYTDDTAGINRRVNDALGIKPVILNSTFSMEVLFYAGKQIYPYATLAGNMNDSSGFIMANIINTPNYFFGINGKGSGLPLPDSQWVYCVMNVYPDHMEIYQDGNLAGAIPIAGPIRQSPITLAIGNVGYMRYFLGGISEVAIHNKVLDKAQVQATWDAIKLSMK